MRSMRADQAEPADTTMMRIVHDALRRDLERARSVIDRSPGPADRQRVAIAEQLDWMMAFLEAHHRSEDLGLYAMVRERDPDAAAVLDEMERDHVSIASEIARVHRAAAAYGVDDTSSDLAESLDSLREALLATPAARGGHRDAAGVPCHHPGRLDCDRATPQPGREVVEAARTGRTLAHRRCDTRRPRPCARSGATGATARHAVRVRACVPATPRCRLAAPTSGAARGIDRRAGRRGHRRGVERRARSDPGRRVESRVRRVPMDRRCE